MVPLTLAEPVAKVWFPPPHAAHTARTIAGILRAMGFPPPYWVTQTNVPESTHRCEAAARSERSRIAAGARVSDCERRPKSRCARGSLSGEERQPQTLGPGELEAE